MIQTMSIREASPEELDQIYRMGFDVWGQGQNPDQYMEACRHSSKYKRGEWQILETERGALKSSLIIYRLSQDVAGIGSIATVIAERRKGHASRLIESVLRSLDRHGIRHVFLFADIAPQFYERFGFAVLPAEYQHHPGSSCMVRTGSLEDLLRNPVFQPPSYF